MPGVRHRGDQIFTDVVGANLCGMKSVLLSPIEPEDGFTFKVRRYFERGLRKNFKAERMFCDENPVERLAERLIQGDSQKAALVFSKKPLLLHPVPCQ